MRKLASLVVDWGLGIAVAWKEIEKQMASVSSTSDAWPAVIGIEMPVADIFSGDTFFSGIQVGKLTAEHVCVILQS